MKKQLVVLACWATLAWGASAQEIPLVDAAATLAAPWEMGAQVATQPISEACGAKSVVRRFLGMTVDGHYLVQDFFHVRTDEAGKPVELKLTDPYMVVKREDVERGDFFKPYERDVSGAYVRWSCDGKERVLGAYENGLQSGPWVFWHANGQKSAEGEYVAGKSHGVWTNWSDNGTKTESGEWSNGERQGLWSEWYDNGQKKSEGALGRVVCQRAKV